jgi:hypothetical protein
LKRRCDRGGCCKNDDKKTGKYFQSDYEDANIGYEFFLPSQYSTLYTYTFLTMVYSGGLPLLYPTTAMYCFVTYWVDKYMLVNFHKQPPNYDIQLAYGIIPYLKWGLMIHILFANVMFGNKAIFSTQPYHPTDLEGGKIDSDSFMKQVEDYEERYRPAAYIYNIFGTIVVLILLY